MNSKASFGQIVRERRGGLGLTQSELARRAGCAPVTVRKIEKDALRPSVQLAELLALALAIPEKEQLAFVRLARSDKTRSPIPKPTPAPDEIGQADLSGRAVKEFQLAEQIGSGGFGVVYRAVQPSVQRDVAVKIILPRFANHPAFIRRFEAEAHLVARLEHPHIVPLYDYWREPNAAYLIMRLLRGGSLDQLLQQGPLPLDVFQQMGQQVGQALAAAHAHDVLHQDIKPANVLLDDGQNAYLADFGIAKNLAFADGGSLTKDGVLISSPAYLSPEQIRDDPLRPSSDVYCFGLLLYEMLTGQKAFQGPTPVSLLQQHLHTPLPLLRDAMSDLPPALDNVLQRATAKQPQQRYADVAAVLNDLNEALQPSVLKVAPPDLSETASLSIQEIAALENPYRGLRAFTEADAAHFFGREALVQELLGLLSNGSDLERFVAVVGPSGSGKSSLVKAGLLPALRRGGLPGSDNWYIVDFTPGSHPWAEVEAALLRVGVNPPEDFQALLQADNRGLLRAVRHCLPDDGATELLLLIDQFEELFTLVEEETVRAQFLESLVTAVLDPGSRLRLVITLRADFTDRPLQYVDFGELLRQRLTLLLPLTPDELIRAITQPIENLGLTMAPELTATIIREVGDQPGMLPLLQYALTELFERRAGATLALAEYQAAGGVTGALAGRADAIYDRLDPPAQAATRQLFLRLVTLGEGVEDTRRRVPLAELEALAVNGNQLSVNSNPITDYRLPNTGYRTLITEYGRHRLLTFDHDPVTRGPTVEVAHEALLREWPRLRGWLRESREDVRRQRELARGAIRWQANKRDESYLLRGSRLVAFEDWAETTTVAPTTDEQDFLQTSVTARDTRQAAEEARRQRELETAQKLAGTLRQRALILGVGLAVAAILTVTAVLFARASNINANLAAAQEAEAMQSYSLALAANARQALDADNQPLALLLALAANSEAGQPLAAWQTLVDIAYAPGVSRQFTHDSPLNAVAVSPDGRFLLTGSDDGLALVWNLASGEVEQRLDGHQAPVMAVAFSPDGRLALSGSADDTAVLWNLSTGEIVHRLAGHKGDVSGVAFTPDGKRAVTSEDTAAAPGDLIVWDVATGEPIRRFGGEEGGNQEGILDMALSADGRFALVGQFSFADTNERPFALWRVDSGEPVHFFAGLDRAVNGVALSPDGRLALAASSDGSLYLWDTETGALKRRLQGHEGPVTAVTFSPDGAQALSASLDQTLILWDVATGAIIRRLRTGTGEIDSLRFLNEAQAVTAASDGAALIWDLTSGWQMAHWGADGTGHLPPDPGTENRGMGLAISPDGRFALSGGNEPDHSLILWDYETGEAVRRMDGPGGSIFAIAFTPDGQQALTAMQDGTLVLWELATGEQVRVFTGHQGSVNSVAISEDGRTALSGALGGAVIYWDLQTGQILQRMIGHFEGRGVYDVAFLPGEQQAVSSSWDGTMIIWDLASGEQIRRLTGLEGNAGSHFAAGGDWGIHGIALSPDGMLLSAGRDESLLLWNPATGQSLRRFSGHTAFVVDVAFAPDGRTALSSARNDALIVWDTSTPLSTGVGSGAPIRRLPINNHLNSSFRPTVAISPDGRTALSTEADGTILQWRLAEPSPEALLDWLAANRVLGELSCAEREAYGIEPLCVDGIMPAIDWLALVGEAARSLETAVPAEPATPEPMAPQPMAGQMGHTAVLGDNPGTLSRHQFDVWTYEGKAGEVLQFQMLADRPLTDATLPLAARAESGMLDTLLFLIAPDGTLLAKANDDPAGDGATQSDANIEAIVLPEDGTYRIEARSYLDDGAGGYTLRITSRAYAVDTAVLQEYVGHFLEGPWKYDVIFSVEDGRLIIYTLQIADTTTLIPLNDQEFLMTDGTRILFTRDESGAVNGYRIWVSLVHPIGGQWYEAVKLEE